MVSEYALGRYEWVLALMFMTQAVSSMALFFAIKAQIHTIGGKIGLFFLLTVGLGPTLAAIHDRTSPLHGLAAMIAIPSQVIMQMLLFTGLVRTGRKLGPEVMVGWPNRIMIVAYCAWLLTAASQASPLAEHNS